MKPARFDYVRPRDVGEALRALGLAAGQAKPLAGGQSLGPMLNLRLARPAVVVDISRLAELQALESRGDHWHIGAGVTHASLEDARGALPGCEMLAEVASGIAFRSVRNRGTVGGSLAHADPAADWPLALAALGATVQIVGQGRRRSVPADAFMTSAFCTALEDDELIAAVEVPKLSRAARWGYYKFCRKTGEFPDASAAIVLDPETGAARMYLGALSGAPRALPELAGKLAREGAGTLAGEALTNALQAALPELDPLDRRLHAGTAARAIRQVFS